MYNYNKCYMIKFVLSFIYHVNNLIWFINLLENYFSLFSLKYFVVVYLHHKKFLRIYKLNHLSLTLDYIQFLLQIVANIDLTWFFIFKCLVEILWNFKTHHLRPSLCWHMHDIWYTFWSIIDWEKGKLIPNIIY